MTDDGPVFERLVFCSGEGADGFGEQDEVVDVKRHLAGFGAEHDSLRLDEVADVEHLVEEVQPFLADLVGAEEQLHLAGAVLDVGEGHLAHRTHGADASRQRGFDLGAILFLRFEFRDQPRRSNVCVWRAWDTPRRPRLEFLEFL
jgi:hypothetical protein